MTAWWIAVQFLTRLPVTLASMPAPAQVGRSVLFYPAVGVLIGGLLVALQALIADSHVLLQGALILAVWVVLTGALHLDGLADSADAWVGGLGDRERTLRIMKDPASGPIAVATILLVLLLKFSALVALIDSGPGMSLLLAPWIARVILPLLLMSTPYIRAGGLGSALVEFMPRQTLRWVLAMHSGALLLFGWSGLLALSVAAAVFYYLRRLMLKRLAGCTGDTAGALVEITECAVLVVLALQH